MKNFIEFLDRLEKFDQNIAFQKRDFLKINHFSFLDMVNLSYGTADYLSHELHLKSNDKVILWANNSPQWLIIFFACQILNITVCPFDATLDLNQQTLDKLQPTLIIKNIYLKNRSNNRTIINIEELESITKPSLNRKSAKSSHPQTPAIIVFTSGTTATPKGVVLSQKNILANVEAINQMIKINSNWRLLSILPLSHMYELTGSLSVLYQGASIFYPSHLNQKTLAKSFRDFKLTAMLAVPEVLKLMLEQIELEAKNQHKSQQLKVAFILAYCLPIKLRRILFFKVHSQLGGHLSYVITGGAPVPLKIAKKWQLMGVRIIQGYGLTETSPIIAVNPLRFNKLNSQGKLLNNLSVRIGHDHEIEVKGPSVFRSYFDQPEATKQSFTSDGYFKTGDTGFIKKNYLYVKGRLKFAIVLSNGLKVYPEDVELAIQKYSTLSEIVIVGYQSHNSEIVLAVVPQTISHQTIENEIKKINQHLPEFQHIKDYKQWPNQQLPKTKLLKYDRKKIINWLQDQKDQQFQEKDLNQSSTNNLESIIANILNTSTLKINDNDSLEELGLDSLRRLSLIASLETNYNVNIDEGTISKSTTIKQLKNIIETQKTSNLDFIISKWQFNRLIRSLGNLTRRTIINSLIKYWVKLEVINQDKFDQLSGPALIIFNHVDNFDGPVIYQSIPNSMITKTAIAAARDVMVEHRLLNFLIKFNFAGFDLNRSQPYLPSLEKIGLLINDGWSVVLSPEGKINTSHQIKEFKSGIGLLVHSLDVPVMIIKTFGLQGTAPLHAHWPKKKSRVKVVIDGPLVFNHNQSPQEITNILKDRLSSLNG